MGSIDDFITASDALAKKNQPVITPPVKKEPVDDGGFLAGVSKIVEKDRITLTRREQEFKQGKASMVNFSMYDKKLEKLQSYGSKFEKYGYNPDIDNEDFYNKNLTNSEQWVRSLIGAGKLFNVGITDNALFGAFAKKDSHKDYAKAVDFYTSAKGGTTGFLQNLVLNGGYTVGIMADMAIEELALAGLEIVTLGLASEVAIPGMLAKGTQSINGIKKGYAMYSNMNKMMKVANKVDDVSKAAKFGNKALNFLNPLENTTTFIKNLKNAETLKDASNLTKVVKGTGSFFRDAKAAHLTWTEANMEGEMLRDELYDGFIENHQGPLSSADVERYRKQADTASWWAKAENIFAIGATNKLVFNNMYKAFDDLKGFGRIIAETKFFKVAKEVGGDAKKIRKGFAGIKDRTALTFADGFGTGMKRVGKTVVSKGGTYFSANIGEGLQENIQEMINTKNKHMYGSAVQGDYFESMLEGIKSQISGQGLETFASGFLMGGVISPINFSVRKLGQATSGKGYKMFTNKDNWKATKESESNRLDSDVKLINELFQDAGDVFNSKGMALAKQAAFEEQMIEAIAEGDVNKFQNAKAKSYDTHLLAAMQYNMMDQFKDHLQEMKTMDAAQFHEAFPTVPLKTTKEDRDEIINEKIKKAVSFEEDYNWVQKNINPPLSINQLDKNDPEYKTKKAYYDYFQQAKAKLIFSKSEFKNNVERKTSLLNSIRIEAEAQNISYTEYEKLTDSQSINKEISILNKEIESLDFGDLRVQEKDLIITKKAKVESLKRYKESLDEMNEIAEKQLEYSESDPDTLTSSDIKDIKRLEKQYGQASTRVFNRHNDYLKTIAPNLKGAAFTNFSQNSFDKLHDHYKLTNRNVELNELTNVLTNIDLLDEQVARNVEMNDAFMTQFKRYVGNSLAMSRDKSTIRTALNDLYVNGIGFNLNELDALVENGIIPSAIYDLETGKVITKMDSVKNKKGIVKSEISNEKYAKSIEIFRNMREKLHVINAPTSNKVEDVKEKDSIKTSGKDKASVDILSEEVAAEADRTEKVTQDVDYELTEEDEIIIDDNLKIEDYPPVVITELLDLYESQIKLGDAAPDSDLASLTPTNLNSRFIQWVDNSGKEINQIIKAHNERVGMPDIFDYLSEQERNRLFELGYETPEEINKLSRLDVDRILKAGTTVEQEVKPTSTVDKLVDDVIIITEDETDATENEGEVGSTSEEETPVETEDAPRSQAEIEEEIDSIQDRIKTLNEFAGNTESNAARVQSDKDVKRLIEKRKVLEEELDALESQSTQQTSEVEARYEDKQVSVKVEEFTITDKDGNSTTHRVTTKLDGSQTFEDKTKDGKGWLPTKVIRNKSLEDVKAIFEKVGDKVTVTKTEGYEAIMNPKMFDRLTPEQQQKVDPKRAATTSQPTQQTSEVENQSKIDEINKKKEESKNNPVKEPKEYAKAVDDYKSTDLGSNEDAKNKKEAVVKQAQTKEGKAFVENQVAQMDYNEDGTITVYRSGTLQEGHNPATTNKQAAEIISSERKKQGLSSDIIEIKIQPSDISAVVPGIESEVLININKANSDRIKKGTKKEQKNKEQLTLEKESVKNELEKTTQALKNAKKDKANGTFKFSDNVYNDVVKKQEAKIKNLEWQLKKYDAELALLKSQPTQTQEGDTSPLTLSENATEEEIEALAEKIVSQNGEQLTLEFEVIPEEITGTGNSFDEALRNMRDENLNYKEQRAEELITFARNSGSGSNSSTDVFNTITALELLLGNNIGLTINGTLITEEVVKDVFELLKKYPGVTDELLRNFADNMDRKISDFKNRDILEAQGKTKEARIKILRGPGYNYTLKDIKNFSKETIDEIIAGKISKKSYIASLKKIEVVEIQELNDAFDKLDTNVRTEQELIDLISTLALDNPTLYEKHRDTIHSKIEQLRNDLSNMKGFSNIKVGSIVEMADGSLKRVTKLTKKGTTLINYNTILENKVVLTESEFNSSTRRIINDFNKNEKGIVSELEKQNIDDLSKLLRNFTTSSLTSVNEQVPTEEELRDYFKTCK